MKVLVCGGRDYADRTAVILALDSLRDVTLIVHGGAPGADSLAGEWAKISGVEVRVYPADWARHGNAAGPIRNGHMLEVECPDLVVAFPGGRGTDDCVRQARRKGTLVFRVSP
jgi:hypothetical protein